jgi:mRNA-degrading endonuclease RelE of RelBE toxin-antitoxin system
MPSTLIYAFRALKDLERLPQGAKRRVLLALEQLAGEDEPERSVKRLRDPPLYSLRAGTYRVILDIRREMITVLAIRDRPRRRLYHDL